MIKEYGGYSGKPKNYSRKISKEGFICSCSCKLITSIKYICNIDVKYEITPTKDRSNYVGNPKKNQWSSYIYSGTFKKIVKFPEIFDNLDETDYVVRIGHFTRDNCQVPYPYEIEILNIAKFDLFKQKEDRRKKLMNLKK